MEPLSPAFRRELRARAHRLHPVVSIGHHGLTPPVLHEIDVALTAHELIKVRVFGDEWSEREAVGARICDALDCGEVQQIGKLLVLWRPRPKERDEAPRPRALSSRTKPGNARPQPPVARAHERGGAPRRRRARAAQAPSGVPRAASPRRRRRAG